MKNKQIKILHQLEKIAVLISKKRANENFDLPLIFKEVKGIASELEIIDNFEKKQSKKEKRKKEVFSETLKISDSIIDHFKGVPPIVQPFAHPIENKETKVELEAIPQNFTGWLKHGTIGNEKWLMYFKNGLQKYGFDSDGEWFICPSKQTFTGYCIKAENEKVSEALKDEAIKRGYSAGILIKGMDSHDDCKLFGKIDLHYDGYLNLGYDIFRNGVWAEIVYKNQKQKERQLEIGREIEKLRAEARNIKKSLKD